jgi:phosphocarrier protein HPr
MPEITLVIHHKVGLHARPAAMFVQTAKEFRSTIRAAHGEREANAKSILSVLTLGVDQGAQVTLRAEGEDAEQALEALATLIESNFGEEA